MQGAGRLGRTTLTSIPLTLGNGKTIGTLVGDVARIPVRYGRHWFRKIGGFSLDAGVLARIERAGARLIEFDDKERGRRFRIGVKMFRQHAEPIEFGFGLKLCAPASCYVAESNPQFGLFEEGPQS